MAAAWEDAARFSLAQPAVKKSDWPALNVIDTMFLQSPSQVFTNVFLSLRTATVTMAELLAIKRELTVIKVQIDGLLDSVDKMDRQRKESSGKDLAGVFL